MFQGIARPNRVYTLHFSDIRRLLEWLIISENNFFDTEKLQS